MSPRMFTSSVNIGSMTGASSRASERSGEALDAAAGGGSLSPGRRSSYAADQLDRRRSRGTSPNSRQSVAASSARGHDSSHSRGRDASMSTVTPVHVGIDVSKSKLDLCLLPSGQTLSVANDNDGIAQI